MFLKYHLSLLLILFIIKYVASKPEIVPDLHKQHLNAEHHDLQYDHDKFLGEDESKVFDSLPPEESKRRLGVIVDKIDTNNDGFVETEELKKWIQYTQRRYIDDDATRQWKQHTFDRDKNGTISWEEYKKNTYGFMDDMDPRDIEREDDGFSYKTMLNRDRRRWAAASTGDGETLTFEEFTVFLHPEDVPRMRNVVVLETLEDIDRDKDGKISVDEYIGDMYKHSENEEEPDWVVSERDVFKKFRDHDGDGFLNKEEIHEWITPKDFDHAEAEAKHLVFEADTNEDNRLTKDEILDKYDLFVGSQATDFGEALTKHDEF
ncbi:calumenin-A [Condylostylus longicornis]|uniref:calumenin-A n=1 Tax=Condylostylus longicornis TaxID=2530218 RepID=UPI00244E3CC1|nr:calumenin-A [Condylostylus longicornis]